MSWKWGKISDLELELEVKRCYQSLLKAEEVSEECVLTHNDIGIAMKHKSLPEENSGKWPFLRSGKIAILIYTRTIELQKCTGAYTNKFIRSTENGVPGMRTDDAVRWTSKLFQPEHIPRLQSPFTLLGSLKGNSLSPKSPSRTGTPTLRGGLGRDDSDCLPSMALHDDTSLTCELEGDTWEGTDGRNGLSNAAKSGQIVRVQRLLRGGAQVNAVDRDGKSPLVHAVENGFTVVAKELIEHGAYVNQRDKNKRTPLRIATEAGKKCLTNILLKNRASVYILDEEIKAPLHYAVEKNFLDIVELLLEFGAPPNQSDGKQKKPLHYAAERGHLSIVELLLSRGAFIDCMDGDMKTPLFIAVEKGLEVMTQTLISRGASVNAADRRRQTALHSAAGNGLLSIALELIANRAGVNSRDDAGKTPLFHAVKGRDVTMANALIQHGAQIDSSDNAGKTILRYAIETNSEALIYLVAKAEQDQSGVRRYVYQRQLLTAIQEECHFLGKTVWNHVLDHCTLVSKHALEYQMMTATVHSLLEATCKAFSRIIHQVLIKLEPILRDGRAESPYLLAHVTALPPHRPLTFMGLPVVYSVTDFNSKFSHSFPKRA